MDKSNIEKKLKEDIAYLEYQLTERLKIEEFTYGILFKIAGIFVLLFFILLFFNMWYFQYPERIFFIIDGIEINIVTIIIYRLMIVFGLLAVAIFDQQLRLHKLQNPIDSLEETYNNIQSEIIKNYSPTLNFYEFERNDTNYLRKNKMIKSTIFISTINSFILKEGEDIYKGTNIILYKPLSQKTTFKGQYYLLNTPLEIKTPIKIISKKRKLFIKKINKNFVKGKNDKRIKLDDMFDKEFNKNFELYCKNDCIAKKILGYKAINFLIDFKKKYPDFQICIEKDNITFLISTKEQLLKMPNKSKETENLSLEKEIQKIEELFKFLETFKNNL